MTPDELKRELEPLHPASLAWARSCVRGDREEAEEVLQAVYLKILEGRARFEGRSSLKTWLFSVIRRTAMARSRVRAVRSALMFRWGPHQLSVEQPDAGRRVEERQTAKRVRRALTALSERQRQILELVFYHGLTVREAASTLGVSAGTASMHYDRAKRRLRGLVENSTESGGER